MLQKILSNFTMNKDISSAIDIINYFKTERTIEEIVSLTEMLAYSGELLPKDENVVDIPSTGGPSSLSTILCPLYLSSIGLEVRKLGVSGRPAGGLDVLYQIPGYRTKYNFEEIKNIIALRIPYFHFESAGTFAPLDAVLFKYRKQLSSINIPQLAIASLLSKKIAMGISNINLDVRAAKFGNFGQTFDECLENAEKFCKVAACFQIAAKCTVSDATIPYQPYIGRREALIAIYNLLYGQPNEWLLDHNNFCMRLCDELIQLTHLDGCNNLSLPNARSAFESNLSFQGASIEKFMDFISAECRKTVVYSTRAGLISYNLDAIRNAIVDAQNVISLNDCTNVYPDPVGVELLVEPGRYVEKEEPVLVIRYRTNKDYKIDTTTLFSINNENVTMAYNLRKREVV